MLLRQMQRTHHSDNALAARSQTRSRHWLPCDASGQQAWPRRGGGGRAPRPRQQRSKSPAASGVSVEGREGRGGEGADKGGNGRGGELWLDGGGSKMSRVTQDLFFTFEEKRMRSGRDWRPGVGMLLKVNPLPPFSPPSALPDGAAVHTSCNKRQTGREERRRREGGKGGGRNLERQLFSTMLCTLAT